MNLPEEIAQSSISRVLEEHPRVGLILQKHQIDCVSCGSTSCLFKNVVATHAYDPKGAARIEAELEAYFAQADTKS